MGLLSGSKINSAWGALLLSVACRAAVSLPGWFGDNMVVQTNSEYGARAVLSGKASPSEQVTANVTMSGKSPQLFEVFADKQGTWAIQLNPSSDYNPFSITVKGEDGPAKVANNVRYGDVFFCSGQSNMQFPLKLAFNATAEIKTVADFPNFRFFMTARANSTQPLEDFSPTPAACDASAASDCNRWLTAKEAAGNALDTSFLSSFSAVCFMTVRDLAKLHTGTRPVGLIQSAWGGTRVEAWISAAALSNTPFAHDVPVAQGPNAASVLYNAMVSPWNSFAVRASLWYQGEANADQKIKGVDQTEYYADILQAMAADWRERKRMGDFAFIVMQLPPSVASGTSYAQQMMTGRMQIRLAEQQAAPRSAGKTDISGVAVGIDLGGASAWGFDHPPNKNEMSRRMALQLLHAAYAQQTPPWAGPEPVEGGGAVVMGPSSVVLHVTAASAEGGMELRDVVAKNINGTSNSCTLCCAKAPPFEVSPDGSSWTLIPQSDINIKNSTLELTLPTSLAGASADGMWLRYAWRDYVECVLYNKQSNLPMGPFLLQAASQADPSPALVPMVQPKAKSQLQSPPLGFNSWNFYHCNIDENTIKAIVDAMVENGMKAAGYQYVNIDDCWQVQRLPNGTVQPDPVRFPSGIAAVADYVHSKGLKFGVYTAQGSRTCQGRPGAYNYEAIDSATYCQWGVDYVKIDNCGGTEYSVLNTSWVKFKSGFEKCPHEIWTSVEYCKDPNGCGEWITNVADMWRTTGDVQATWASVMSNIHSQNNMHVVARPGKYNDPDMLQVGNVGLSFTEQQAHMSLWCLASAPLLAGTDIIHATPETLSLLTNPEVLAVNQDFGLDGKVQGTLLPAAEAHGAAGTDASAEVWAKPLSDGSFAVILLNLKDNATGNVSVHFSQLGLPAGTHAIVRDLWLRKDLGLFTDVFSAQVPAHGTVFIKVVLSTST